MISYFGKKIIESHQESDKLLAHLCMANPNSFVQSTDSDLLAHGCPFLMQFPDFKANTTEVYDLKEILSTLEMDHRQFVQFCVLLGTDYNQPINKVGPHTAYQLAKRDDIVSDFKKISQLYSSADGEKLEVIRDHFLSDTCPKYSNVYLGLSEEQALQKLFGPTLNTAPRSTCAQVMKNLEIIKKAANKKLSD